MLPAPVIPRFASRFIGTFAVLLTLHAAGEEKSDVDLARLNGPVRSVQVEKSVYTIQYARHVQEPRILETVTDYDTQGRKTEHIEYNADGTILSRRTYHYGGAGRLAEEKVLDAHGTLVEQTIHTYDRSGKEIATSHYDGNGKLQQKTVHVYDDNGLLSRSCTSNSEAEFISEQVFTYNESGRLVKTVTRVDGNSLGETMRCEYDNTGRVIRHARYDSNDDLQYTTVYSYGDMKTMTIHDSATGREWASTYDRDGNITERSEPGRRKPTLYEYQYDSHGNWIEKKALMWYRQRGHGAHPYYAPSKVEYRTIRYY